MMPRLNMASISSCFPGVDRLYNSKWSSEFKEHRFISRKANSSSRVPSIFIGDSLVKKLVEESRRLFFIKTFLIF